MKIICIGRNYAEHAKELNNPLPTEPVFFMKPDTALLLKNQPFYYPEFTNDLHHEIEVVVRIDKAGKYILPEFAHNYYNAVTVGIDFTARDLQQKCKEKGLPWELAKAFDKSAPMGNFISIEKFKKTIDTLDFHLDINGKTVQKANTSSMIFNINQIIAYVSQFVSLRLGDLIFTGTPSGVGPVKIGDVLSCYLEGKKLLEFEVK
jgi:acylpyruvate hydrolase